MKQPRQLPVDLHTNDSTREAPVSRRGQRNTALAPVPAPSSAAARKVMLANRRVNTGPERRLRSALHRLGLRYQLDKPIITATTRVRPDIVFVRAKVAVFVDGCF